MDLIEEGESTALSYILATRSIDLQKQGGSWWWWHGYSLDACAVGFGTLVCFDAAATRGAWCCWWGRRLGGAGERKARQIFYTSQPIVVCVCKYLSPRIGKKAWQVESIRQHNGWVDRLLWLCLYYFIYDSKQYFEATLLEHPQSMFAILCLHLMPMYCTLVMSQSPDSFIFRNEKYARTSVFSSQARRNWDIFKIYPDSTCPGISLWNLSICNTPWQMDTWTRKTPKCLHFSPSITARIACESQYMQMNEQGFVLSMHDIHSSVQDNFAFMSCNI